MRFGPARTLHQLDGRDCGPTCLRIVADHYGIVLSADDIRRRCDTGKNGTSFRALTETAIELGFDAMPTTISFEALVNDVPLPCIIHWNNGHYVVVLKINGRKRVKVADPSDGSIRNMEMHNFQSYWIMPGHTGGHALLLEPTANLFNNERFNDQSPEVGWLKIFLKKYRVQLLHVALCIGIATCLQSSLPFVTQQIVDVGIQDHSLSMIQLLVAAQVALLAGRASTEFLRSRILMFLSTHVNFSLLSAFWIKLTLLPISFFERRNAGDIYQRISDHKRIESFLTGPMLNTLFSLFSLSVSSCYLLYYSKSVFLVFCISCISYVLFIRLFLRSRRDLDNRKFSTASLENNLTVQFIQGMQDIKLNGAEQVRRTEWNSIQAHVFKINVQFLTIGQLQQIGSIVFNEGKNLLVTYLVARSVVSGDLTLGTMLSIQYLIGQLTGPMEQLTAFSQQLQEARLSLSRLNAIHRLDNEEQPGAMQFDPERNAASISIRDLSFKYDRFAANVLNGINVEIPANEITAIVGASGAGKTTLLKLLLNFYTDYEGDILIGDVNLKHISSRSWRKHCGVIMQDGFIYTDSIAKNIAVFETRPDYDKLLYACHVANIADFVASLPKGLDTIIGNDGHGLSQGQKQRILIARAVYKDPKFLFIDEGTNALDANNEVIIMQRLAHFFKNRTVVIVAHRLSTIRNADNILVFNENRIIESGNHERLLSNKGAYYALVQNQLVLSH